jgi:hypothetical protein
LFVAPPLTTPPTITHPLPHPHFQAEPVLPSSLILWKRKHKI